MALWHRAGERTVSDVLFGDTVTLYNHYREAREDKWQRSVLRGVQIRRKQETSATENGLKLYETVSISIPVSADAGGRHYMEPSAFASASRRKEYWTLNASTNLDVMVLGECTKELTEEFTLASLKKDTGFVTMKAVRDNTLRRHLKHWKVTCV